MEYLKVLPVITPVILFASLPNGSLVPPRISGALFGYFLGKQKVTEEKIPKINFPQIFLTGWSPHQPHQIINISVGEDTKR